MYSFIENSVIKKTSCCPSEGYVWIDGAICGQIYNEETKILSNPDIEVSIFDQIKKIESKQTQRLLREASLGDAYAKEKLQEIDNEIKSLREKL